PVGVHTLSYLAVDNDGAESPIVTRYFSIEDRLDALQISLTKSDLDKGEFEISWNDVDSAQSYQLMVKKDNGSYAEVYHADPLSYYKVELDVGTYLFKVRACFATNDCGEYSGEFIVAINSPETPTGTVHVVKDTIVPGEEGFETYVTPNGDAAIDIPVYLPPGVNGLQPNLGLAYNSSRISYSESRSHAVKETVYHPGDFVGLGWQLTGLPTIHLCHTNEAVGLADLFSLKFYCLDGQRLIRKGDTKEFVLENNPNVKIKHFGITAIDAGYFEVYRPNGSVWTYGGDYGASNPGFTFTSHVISDERTASTTRYALSNVTSVDGNQMHIGWVRPWIFEKEVYPKEITYGNNEDTRIIFDYADRLDGTDIAGPDALHKNYGSLLSTLSAINILQKDDAGSYQKISQYILYHDYPTDLFEDELPHRQLSQIQRCGFKTDGVSECYAPVKVDWQKVDPLSRYRYVNKITSSLGAVAQFDIVQMGDDHPESYFSEKPFGEGITPAGSDTAKAKKVVAMHKSNGIGGTNTLRYAYQGDVITHIEGPDRPGRMTQYNGMFAQRVTNEQTGHISYVQNYVDKPYLGKVAQTRVYNAVYTGNSDIPLSIQENHYAHNSENHGYLTANAPYLKTTTRYAFEAGNLVVVNQIDNTHTFVNNLIDNTVQTVKAASAYTPGNAGSFWGDKTKATLTGVIRTTVSETSIENRSGDNYWLTNFATSGTISNYAGDDSTGQLDSRQSFEATPYNLTNKIHTLTKFKGDTDLELTTTNSYNTVGQQNGATISGSHITQRSSSITSFQDGRYPSASSNALGHTTSAIYDNRFGLATSATDINSQTTDYSFNSLGQLDTSDSPDNVKTTVTRVFCQQVGCEAVAGVLPIFKVQISSALLPTRWAYYDTLKRVIRTQTQQFGALGVVNQDTLYDGFGRVSKLSKPYDPANTLPHEIVYASYNYDALGRLSSEQRADSSAVNVTYQYVSGNIQITTKRKVLSAFGVALPDQVEVVTLNPLGEVITKTDAKNTSEEISTSYHYYGDGQIETIQVGNNPAISFEFDNAGNRRKMSDPNTGLEDQLFNGLGLIRQSTNNAGQITSYSYDLLNRKTLQSHQDGGTSAWIFDTYNSKVTHGALMAKSYTPTVGQPADYLESIEYYANAKPKKVSTTLSVAGFSDRTYNTSFTYDSLGRLDNTTYPTGLVVQSKYSNEGYLSGLYDVNDTTHLQTINSLNAMGNTTKQTFGNGVVTDYVFDDITNATKGIYTQGNGFNIQSNSYLWRSNGQLERRQQNVNETGQSEVRYDAFTYDNLNRLTDTTTYKANWLMRKQHVGYDLVGNITTKTGDDVADSKGTNYQ
ncbi:MAG: RHS repeat protein, partial [Algicola sp.]|nr:RHS repeat protein [Algicola sp.]